MTDLKLRFATFAVVLACASADAAEPYLEFVAGLRARGYFDTALDYLSEIETQQDVPADIKAMILFERGLTHLQQSRSDRSPEARSKRLDLAQAQFEQFVKAHPNHAKAGEANSQQANILLGRAQVNVWQARSPSNASRKAELRNEARQLIGKARQILKTAHDQFRSKYESFAKFIPPEQKTLYNARARAELDYMKAQLDLAHCTYEEGQTYDSESEQRGEILTRASQQYEEVHNKYRGMVGGLFARLWQGKCFEEQGDLGKALGIYNELLLHSDSSPVMRKLQDQARHFRYICLNDDSKKDYKLVAQEANVWLVQSKARSRTEVGLGIRWELARSLEQLGANRGLKPPDRERFLKQSLEQARKVNKYPGAYKDLSTFMIRRLNVSLGREGGDPQDFGTAYELGRNMVKQVKPLKDKTKNAANAKLKQQAKTDLNLHLKDTARMLNLAVGLSDESTPINDLSNARYLLSYVYFLSGLSYESGILSEFVSRHFIKDSPEAALDAGHLAMAAYQQAYYAIPKGQNRDVELQLMQRACEHIANNWPSSDRANDARLTLGSLYAGNDQPVEAAKWYGQVPPTATQYAVAQLEAGQAYWQAYLRAALLTGAERPDAAQLETWQKASEEHLRRGAAKATQELPEQAEAPESLTAAKVSLAQIAISRGDYQQAADGLNSGSHSVVKAIQGDADAERPEKGVKSLPFAQLVLQLLLRSYVGTRQIDQALETMNRLEALGGDDNTSVYVQLGQELEKELKRLKGLDQQERLDQVRQSFESFLNELYERSEGQTYNSLIWIAETYYGLGLGTDDNPTAAATYFAKASSTYQAILKSGAEQGADFVAPQKVPAITLRLVNCKRREGDFPLAHELIVGLLRKSPKALNAQYEGAQLLEDWGSSGADNKDKLLLAIRGEDPIWGWAQLGRKLQAVSDAGKASTAQEEKLLQSRLGSARCRLHYGQAEAAKQELEVFASVTGEPDEQWRQKFDALYREIQQDLGQDPGALPWPERYALAAVVTADNAGNNAAADKPSQQTEPASEAAKPVQQAAVKPAGGMNALMLGLLLVVGLAGGGGFVFVMAKPRRSRVSYAGTAAPPSVADPAAARPKKKRSSAPRPPVSPEQRARKKKKPPQG